MSIKDTIDCLTAFKTDFRPNANRIDVDTLVIHGDDDQAASFEASGKLAAEMIAGANLNV